MGCGDGALPRREGVAIAVKRVPRKNGLPGIFIFLCSRGGGNLVICSLAGRCFRTGGTTFLIQGCTFFSSGSVARRILGQCLFWSVACCESKCHQSSGKE